MAKQQRARAAPPPTTPVRTRSKRRAAPSPATVTTASPSSTATTATAAPARTPTATSSHTAATGLLPALSPSLKKRGKAASSARNNARAHAAARAATKLPTLEKSRATVAGAVPATGTATATAAAGAGAKRSLQFFLNDEHDEEDDRYSFRGHQYEMQSYVEPEARHSVRPDPKLSAMLEGPLRVVAHADDVYDACLSRACVRNGTSEFIQLQVVERDAAHDGRWGEFYVWMCLGDICPTLDALSMDALAAMTTDMQPQPTLHGPLHSQDEATTLFEDLFRTHTRTVWTSRRSAVAKDRSFTWVEMQHSFPSQVEAQEGDSTSSYSKRRRFGRTSRRAQTTPPPTSFSLATWSTAAYVIGENADQAVPAAHTEELHVPVASLPVFGHPPPSRLDERVQDFVTMMTNATQAHVARVPNHLAYGAGYSHTQPLSRSTTPLPHFLSTAAAVGSPSITVPLPLGRLAVSTIKKGYTVLGRVMDALEDKADLPRLCTLSNRFYSLIPHAPPLPVLDSMPTLGHQLELLVAMGIALGYGDQLHGHAHQLMMRCLSRHPLDASYAALQCSLEPLASSSAEFELVQSYIFNSYCCFAGQSSVVAAGLISPPACASESSVVHVFRVDRLGEEDRFAPYRQFANRRILWHGSRMSNWLSILSHGLLIKPRGVPHNGSAFGDGIYFTDKISRAMGYSQPTGAPGDRRQVFVLCEVALGDCKTVCTNSASAAATAAIMASNGGGGASGSSLAGSRKSGSRRSSRATVAASTAAVQTSAASVSSHRSCHGVGRCISDVAGDYEDTYGAVWPLGKATPGKNASARLPHNEFVVYDEAQVRMRYIVVTDGLLC